VAKVFACHKLRPERVNMSLPSGEWICFYCGVSKPRHAVTCDMLGVLKCLPAVS